MNVLIQDFTNHLLKAISIGKNTSFNSTNTEKTSVLVCGLGGSGIGGSIVNDLISKELKIPFVSCKGYTIPEFVDENTLVICSSYSGNTEETLMMYEQAKAKGAEIAIVSSGGKFIELAKANGHNFIEIPGGLPPRAAFGYSFPQLLFVLEKYGLINNSFENQLSISIEKLNDAEDEIVSDAKKLSDKLFNTTPILYSESSLEGVMIRFRQQINENAKMLCWHNVIPEMNHNELVGWRTKDNNFSVVIFRTKEDHYRNQARIEHNKNIFSEYTDNVNEIWAKGKSAIERALYLIHLGDWVSYFLAEKKQIDSVEVDVITGLKNMLSDLD